MTFKDHLLHPPCHGQGHLQLDKVVQSLVQPDLESSLTSGSSSELIPRNYPYPKNLSPPLKQTYGAHLPPLQRFCTFWTPCPSLCCRFSAIILVCEARLFRCACLPLSVEVEAPAYRRHS